VTVDRMSPLDASFLHIEDDVTHMHIGSVSVFEGPPPPYEDVLAMIAGKLDRVPRYRQVVRSVPFDLGRPVWVPAPHFRVEYHLRHTALPRPGGEDELRALVGRLMGQQLDRRKPLWEIWMVEGLQPDRWALISKVHHCMVDGVSGTDLLSLLLDDRADARPQPPAAWSPPPVPSGLSLAVAALSERMLSPFEQARAVRAALRGPRRVAAQLAGVLEGLGSTRAIVRSSASSLNGPIGPHRRWAGAVTDVATVRRIRAGLGGTFNDVLLAAVTRGFRDLLVARGEPVDHPVRTLVPVSVRARDARGRAVGDGTLANRVSAVFADLPVDEADPVRRLQRISSQMTGLKDSRQAVAAEVLTSAAGFTPPSVLALAARLAARAQRQVQTVTTNVPGPQSTLYAGGRRMLLSYPFVPLGAGLRLGVAMFSYDGTVTFGVTADYDTGGDFETLVRGIESGMAELLAAAQGAPTAGSAEAPSGSAEAPSGSADSPSGSAGAPSGGTPLAAAHGGPGTARSGLSAARPRPAAGARGGR